MGSCFSKKTVDSSSQTPIPDPPILIEFEKMRAHEEDSCKKNISAIKCRTRHEIDCSHSEEENKIIKSTVSDCSGGIRTSSCTKEEVDAILIQCGRLSNSGSSIQGGRKYSGSKRSFDFDNEAGDQNKDNDIVVGGDAEEAISDRIHRHRQGHRDGSCSPRGRRRRGLSRESGEGGNGSGERRMSRSPGRRSESPITSNRVVSGSSGKPGKLVSVPATVSCNKAKNGGRDGVVEAPSADAIKRVQVKRNVASPRAQSPARTNVLAFSNEIHRTAASTRAQSPARTNVLAFSNEVHRTAASTRAQSPARTNVMGSLNEAQRTAASPRARSPARINVKAFSNEVQRTAESPCAKSPARAIVKASSNEVQKTAASTRAHSPARTNVKAASNEVQRTAASPRAQSQTKNNVKAGSNEVQIPVSRHSSRKNEQSPYRRNPLCEIDSNVTMHKHSRCKVINQAAMTQKSCTVVQENEGKGSINRSTNVQKKQLVQEAKEFSGNVPVNMIPSGSEGLKPQSLTRSRSSRLCHDLETNSETSFNSSYATLLLEDIQNFHQKTAPATAFSLPACVTKAHSIVDAVADLNSSTNAKKRTRYPPAQKYEMNEKISSVVSNDLMEPINQTFTSM